MPRAHSAIEAIDREAQALVEKIKRAEEHYKAAIDVLRERVPPPADAGFFTNI